MTSKRFPLFIAVFIVCMIGCRGNNSVSDSELFPPSTFAPPAETPVVQYSSPKTPTPDLTNTPSKTATTAPTRTETSTTIPTILPETRLRVECLDVLQEIPAGAVSNGIVVLGKYFTDQDRRYETVLRDMNMSEMTTLTFFDEFQHKHIVSKDKTLIAYMRITSDQNNNEVKELVFATANGHVQKVVPWGDNWAHILGWTQDQRILLTYDDPELAANEKWNSIFAFLAFDPFSGEKELLHPVFPERLTNTILPYWDGWSGVVYDPTLTRAVVPKVFSDDDEHYTFALWDITTQELVSSLESVLHESVFYSDIAPQPFWSDDGTSFAFVGQLFDDAKIEFELFQVSRDGQIEQLTNLSPIYRASSWRNIWSPDGSKIAMIIDFQPEIEGFDVLVLDLGTKEIIDPCISMRGNINKSEAIPPLIWSPDGQQFLIKDWIDDTNSRIILVDIKQGWAAPIAENMNLNGWMKSP